MTKETSKSGNLEQKGLLKVYALDISILGEKNSVSCGCDARTLKIIEKVGLSDEHFNLINGISELIMEKCGEEIIELVSEFEDKFLTEVHPETFLSVMHELFDE